MTLNIYKNIDNSPLILFRILFGFLVAAESFGAILTGWVKKEFLLTLNLHLLLLDLNG